MSWPWQRHRRDQLDAQHRVDAAERRALAASRRKALAKKQAAQSRQVTTNLRKQIEKNGWTELLENAWGGR